MTPLALYKQLRAAGMDEAGALVMAEQFETSREAETDARHQALLDRLGLDVKAEARKAKDRDRKRAKVGIPRNSTESAESAEIAEMVSPVPSVSPKPPSTTLNPIPSEPKGSSEKTTRARKGPAFAKSRRCPNPWMPSETDVAMARREGFTPGEIDRELAKIRDHEFRTPRNDWDAVFRNWIRKAAEDRSPRKAHERPDQPSPKFAAKLDNMASAQRGAERAIARGANR